jgi:hypothetical protein
MGNTVASLKKKIKALFSEEAILVPMKKVT